MRSGIAVGSGAVLFVFFVNLILSVGIPIAVITIAWHFLAKYW